MEKNAEGQGEKKHRRKRHGLTNYPRAFIRGINGRARVMLKRKFGKEHGKDALCDSRSRTADDARRSENRLVSLQLSEKINAD